ncbi:hypothetical protein [Natrinema sp. 1APR25-10V2]|uniref:hypothetical protein n=1 Tax=Natrinema sp. 1APR25-10V2 TaxID=2951081 RepID=UPI0028741CFF|nr:hypothetical protein [Natrinema sp. 1APR25-10V2]MDS0476229.1 hypothetical protein [Natrinema sp. 1APR25-10V2]
MDAITRDEPLEARRWHWKPARPATLDAVLVFAWGFLTVGNAVSGEPLAAVVWGSFAAYALVFVVDRGPFELRFDRDEFEDLEDVRAAIERRLENTDSRADS